MRALLDLLADNPDPRTLGRSAEVAALVLADPDRLDELFDGLASGEDILMARSADALERVATANPDLIQPYKRELLTRAAHLDHWVVRAHVCQMLPRLNNLTRRERARALTLVRGFLDDRSSIVKAVALDCLVQLSLVAGFEAEHAAVAALVDRCAARGETAALRARARKMQRQLAKLARSPKRRPTGT